MQLRQVALVAHELDSVRETIFALLGLDRDFADEGVAEFGLKNSVMAIGHTFLEVVAPLGDGTTAGRLLERRGGDGGYMVLVQVEDIEPVSRHVDSLGIRKVWQTDRDEVTAFHLHPKDMGAAIVSIDQMRPPGEWIWAGPGWRNRKARHVSTISAVTLQALDPEDVARRWSSALAVDYTFASDHFVLMLDQGQISVVEASDGRGDGVAAIQFDTDQMDNIGRTVDDLGLSWRDNAVEVCGTRFQFRVC